MSDYSKYNVPDFFVEPKHIPIRYVWWCWHPLWSKWKKSCWGGDTIDEALEIIESDYCSSLKLYHNKLIRESIEGYEEVLDVPCKHTDIWDKCLKMRENKI